MIFDPTDRNYIDGLHKFITCKMYINKQNLWLHNHLQLLFQHISYEIDKLRSMVLFNIVHCLNVVHECIHNLFGVLMCLFDNRHKFENCIFFLTS
jgi:hypothetical protein